MSTVSAANTAFSNRTYQSGNLPQRELVQTLGQQDFLKLLATQMSTQDPLKPMEDTAFIGQMAQFSSLEQSRSMQQDIESLQAGSLLGQQVILQVEKDKTAQGVVEAVKLEAGTPKLIVGGKAYGMELLLSVANPPPQTSVP
jgi:flagellar basal-body rod modification protein FlgD